MKAYEIEHYLRPDGSNPYRDWLLGLRDKPSQIAVQSRIFRIAAGNLGDYKAVGDGVFELRVFKGPGFRIYFAFEGQTMVLLLTGGDKANQTKDIETAKSYYADYKRRTGHE